MTVGLLLACILALVIGVAIVVVIVAGSGIIAFSQINNNDDD